MDRSLMSCLYEKRSFAGFAPCISCTQQITYKPTCKNLLIKVYIVATLMLFLIMATSPSEFWTILKNAVEKPSSTSSRLAYRNAVQSTLTGHCPDLWWPTSLSATVVVVDFVLFDISSWMGIWAYYISTAVSKTLISANPVWRESVWWVLARSKCVRECSNRHA